MSQLLDSNPLYTGYGSYMSPTNPMADFFRYLFDTVYAPVMDHVNRNALTPEARAHAIETNPDFRKAAEEWARYMQYYNDIVNPR